MHIKNIYFLLPGLQNRLHVPAPHCTGEAATQERSGDSCDSDGVHVRRRRHSTFPSEVTAAATAARENTLAQFTQQLHESERVRWGERGERTHQDHGESLGFVQSSLLNEKKCSCKSSTSFLPESLQLDFVDEQECGYFLDIADGLAAD